MPSLVAGVPSWCAVYQECPPRVHYSPEIEVSMFPVYILSDTPEGVQREKSILLMTEHVNIMFGSEDSQYFVYESPQQITT
jgi:hypothetical protein